MPLPKGPKPKNWLEKAAQIKPKKSIEESGWEVSRAKWSAMKEEFLELTINGKDVHWPTLAAKYGFKPSTARHKASTEKWYAEIEERRKLREDILEKKLTERTTMALDKLNQDFATDEAAIRKRHATTARQLQVKAFEKLKTVTADQMSVRDALFMLQMGINEERLALGMPQLYEGPKVGDNQSKEFTPVVEQLGGHKRIQQIGVLMLKALQSDDVERLLEGGDDDEDGLKDPKVVSDVKPKG